MGPRLKPVHIALIVLVLLAIVTCSAASEVTRFTLCEDKVRSIINGTYTEGNINSVTIKTLGYLYEGPVNGLKASCPRSEWLTLTLEGCDVLCGSIIDVAQPAEAISITATWIFPLAILLNLPYESYHDRKVRGILGEVLNWLGSPQSALTATLWNFRQIRACHRRSKASDGKLNDAYYILSCLNQYDISKGLPEIVRPKKQKAVDGSTSDSNTDPEAGVVNNQPDNWYFKTLIYGLLRPKAHISEALALSLKETDEPVPLDMLLTEELLENIAFQLRMLRRRSVIPTLASLALFLVAFVFSVVLTFGDLGTDINILYMSLGLFLLWLPMLVTFSIVDRNPISSTRTATLLSRYLYNVNAVRTWSVAQNLAPKLSTLDQINWWTRDVNPQDTFPVGRFLGQGRIIQYCGLAHAVLNHTSPDSDIKTKDTTRQEFSFENAIAAYDTCGDAVATALRGPKPASWYSTAVVSCLLVWNEIMMAVMFAFNTPTVGPGCWSGSCFLYGALSTVTWLVQFQKKPARWARMVAFAFNALALGWLVTTIVLQLSGVFNNCYCLSAPIARGMYGGYMDFANSLDYRNNFDVLNYWIAAAVVGGMVPMGAFVVAVFWWLKCQHLPHAPGLLSRDRRRL
ncbi:hypothetical protein B0T22DRAFT_502102 [Podospora appendiculata]|uniref:Uncharacterized protein n=1 Tax=Podospora appendiculata TaxID=314037 RepID=A0AAE0X2C2_9PEZI|nr:hypothetical protein B0T22DRAFT_502102 [Podospora appendiculata]